MNPSHRIAAAVGAGGTTIARVGDAGGAWNQSTSETRTMKKGALGREKKGSGVLPADQSSFATLFYYTITEMGVLFPSSHAAFWYNAKPAGHSAECPTIITRKWTQLEEPD